jgi:hypothetical protein
MIDDLSRQHVERKVERIGNLSRQADYQEKW